MAATPCHHAAHADIFVTLAYAAAIFHRDENTIVLRAAARHVCRFARAMLYKRTCFAIDAAMLITLFPPLRLIISPPDYY